MKKSLFRFVPLLMPALLAACVSSPRAETSRPIAGPPPVMRPAPATIPSATPPAGLTQSISTLVRNFKGKVGLAIARSDAPWTIANHGSSYFPQQSVSKLWVAMTVLDAVDKGRLRLDDPVTVRASDRTVFNQPIMQYVNGASGYETTIGDLLRFSMILSDNTANDLLMKRAGGPEAVRHFIAANSLGGIRFGPGEALLQAGTAGLDWNADYATGRNFEAARAKLSPEVRQAAWERYLADPVDGASPVAMARALLRLKKGELLGRSSTDLLLTRMSESKTGPERLKGGVPLGWRFAHKTGTGQNWQGATAGYNDVALLTAPDGTSYAVVVLIGETSAPIADRKLFMQAISAAVAEHHLPVVGRAASR